MDFSDLGIHFKGCDKTITMVQLKTILNHYGKKFTSKDKKPELCKMVEDVIKQVGSKGPAAIAAAAALHQQALGAFDHLACLEGGLGLAGVLLG